MTDLIPMAPTFTGEPTGTFGLSATCDPRARLATLVHSALGVGELTKGLHLHFGLDVPMLNELRTLGRTDPEAAIATLRDMARLDARFTAMLDFILDRLIHFSGHTREWMLGSRP